LNEKQSGIILIPAKDIPTLFCFQAFNEITLNEILESYLTAIGNPIIPLCRELSIAS
jgi:hypothetical protein